MLTLNLSLDKMQFWSCSENKFEIFNDDTNWYGSKLVGLIAKHPPVIFCKAFLT